MPNLSPMNLMAAGKGLMVRGGQVFEEKLEQGCALIPNLSPMPAGWGVVASG